MSINAKILEDRVIIKYHNRKPYGQPDDDGEMTVMFDKIGFLSPIPEIYLRPSSVVHYTKEEINIPSINKTLVCIIEAMDCCGGPPDEVLNGPFIKE